MSEFALEVENLVKNIPLRAEKAVIRAVDGMSFRVPREIIFGLLGPNGAGKSSLLRHALHAYAPYRREPQRFSATTS